MNGFDNPAKNKNLVGKRLWKQIERDEFIAWLDQHYEEVEFIFHLGARTDTTTSDKALLQRLNTNYTKALWKRCGQYQIPFVYASSAATYGKGENGYEDDEAIIPKLKPLNLYGVSKNEFDKWALQQKEKPFFWAGLKFFNVYGPNEYHKGRMASVIWHTFNQLQATGKMKLFRSHHPNFEDGKQKRDFIYVKDVVKVCYFLMHHRKHSGIYNLGTGQARTFLDLTRAVFKALKKEEYIEFIDIPKDIREQYQYFTEAKMDKLRNIGYEKSFTALEEGVGEYVKDYLLAHQYR